MNIQKGNGEEKKASGQEHLVQAPALSLPKGGGAIRGIGEKFAANPVTGTGSMTVPIATSPGRSGFGPQLSLSYDSGAGNGPFGWGWSHSHPAITCKTEKGLPRYRHAEESDVFILSGAEDLVPVLVEVPEGSDQWQLPTPVTRTLGGVDYLVNRYRPRLEGLFARIERWTAVLTGEAHWRSITRDNVTTLYGKTANSRIADPADPTGRIFSWLICESYDDKGNAIVYEYKNEDSQRIFEGTAGQLVTLVHETHRDRDEQSRTANRYLERIKYGNRTPNRDLDTWDATDPASLPSDTWMFEVVFDYGEGHYAEDEPDAAERIFARATIDPPTGSYWPVRQDPFSTYRAGFEVRTYRLCRRVLMFHHFPEELGITDCLVRSTELTYSESPIASFITEVTQSGYLRQPSDGQANRYLKKSLPPVEFEYSRAEIHQEVRMIDEESLENLPYGLDGAAYQWVDLDGDGVGGILTEQANGWFFKRNLSPTNQVLEDGIERTVARFAPVELVAARPAPSLSAGEAQFMDLAGDGQLDVVTLEHPAAGFYERTEDDPGWEPFRPFVSSPMRDLSDPNVKFIDLDGDGHADILISEDQAFSWHASLAELGFGPATTVPMAADEETGPRLVFADGTDSIHLADLSGDGLTDLVRIRNGETCYWPNLGYGRFGAKVTMDGAPWFDTPDQFDQRRIRLADMDGSGTTDLFYLGADGVTLWRNQCGNAWSAPERLPVFPTADNLAAVQVVDLLGNGTACLVWSSPLPGHQSAPMRYVDLMGGQKPHLLIKVTNNLGAETHVHYAPSTRYYLADRQAGKPWLTRLPFPVHVVERVVTLDHVSRNRFVTRSAYSHGFFDGVERQFCGFAMVVQRDTEELAALMSDGILADAENIDATSYVPTVVTKTWFHTGAFVEGGRVSRQFEREYYRETDASLGAAAPGLSEADLRAMLLDDTVLPPIALSADELREAHRSLKGATLRQEVYSEDPTQEADRPYVVRENNYQIKRLQPRAGNRHAVFFTHAREAIEYHYERKLYDVEGTSRTRPPIDAEGAPIVTGALRADPRVTHAMTLEVDSFGAVKSAVAVAYGSRYRDADPALTDADRDKQQRLHATWTLNDYTEEVDAADAYRTPLLAETRTYELMNLSRAQYPHTNLFRFAEMEGVVAEAAERDVLYEDIHATVPAGVKARRLIERVRSYFRSDDLTERLDLGQMGTLTLPYETYKLAFTPRLLSQVYRRTRAGQPEEILLDPAAVMPHPAGAAVGTALDRGGYVDLDEDEHWWIPSGRVFFSPGPEDMQAPPDGAAVELAAARRQFFLPGRYLDPFGEATRVLYDTHLLAPIDTKDALGNRVTTGERLAGGGIEAAIDYRVLAPTLMTDPNGNRAAVAFDALGLVAGTAVMGKPAPAPAQGDSLDGFTADLTEATHQGVPGTDDFFAAPRGSSALTLLADATTRIVYDLDRFQRTQRAQPNNPEAWLPACAATIARETHASDEAPTGGAKLQVSVSSSDGFGREIQKKVQAEPGPIVEGGPPVDRRWVVSGWTIFNNKLKPVLQYEPFFDDTHEFVFGYLEGVSPILFYDPLGRVVATLHPNHTWEKVVFDPWRQETWDVNDTVAVPDPKTDRDAGAFFARLPESDYLPTWHQQRQAVGVSPSERDAAVKAEVHAGTPAVAYSDTLGRPFLTVAHNRFLREGAPVEEPPVEELHRTRVDLDIEGNEREVVDALDRIVMRYDYDMLGSRIHQTSMEAGERWMLNDVAGKPIRAWDSRGHTFRTEYDPLRRPLQSYVTGADPRNPADELLVERLVYGEQHPGRETHNLRGRVCLHFDQAGLVTNEGHDFKGNLLQSSRRLAGDYKLTLNWRTVDDALPSDSATELDLAALDVALAPTLETAAPLATRTTYDALNRPVQLISPHGGTVRPNVIQPSYNEAGLLERTDVWLQQEEVPESLLSSGADLNVVTGIEYNAKGQRKAIGYHNRARSTYDYDPLTFRLLGITTKRFGEDTGEDTIQNLDYTYDPAGNITEVTDGAQDRLFHADQEVLPRWHYEYDAVYRLIEAQGREHSGQLGQLSQPDQVDFSLTPTEHPNDPQAMRNYTERYLYDQVGNILEMNHIAESGGWVRKYDYAERSLIEAGKVSNRLTANSLPGDLGQRPYSARYDRRSDLRPGYDEHGNMTVMPHLFDMLWDFKDQLHEVDLGGGGRAYFVYDGAGQRVRKVVERNGGSLIQERIYLGGWEVYREQRRVNGGASNLILERETLHVMDGERRVVMIETKTRSPQGDTSPSRLIRFQLTNHLGSAHLEINEESIVISYEEFHPYGTTSYRAVTDRIEVNPNRYRYTGMERDEEASLAYHTARYYVPWLGRWCSADPVGLAGGENLFLYISNPITMVDPQGNDGFQLEISGGIRPGRFTPHLTGLFTPYSAGIENEPSSFERVSLPWPEQPSVLLPLVQPLAPAPEVHVSDRYRLEPSTVDNPSSPSTLVDPQRLVDNLRSEAERQVNAGLAEESVLSEMERFSYNPFVEEARLSETVTLARDDESSGDQDEQSEAEYEDALGSVAEVLLDALPPVAPEGSDLNLDDSLVNDNYILLPLLGLFATVVYPKLSEDLQRETIGSGLSVGLSLIEAGLEEVIPKEDLSIVPSLELTETGFEFDLEITIPFDL